MKNNFNSCATNAQPYLHWMAHGLYGIIISFEKQYNMESHVDDQIEREPLILNKLCIICNIRETMKHQTLMFIILVWNENSLKHSIHYFNDLKIIVYKHEWARI